ncbi:cytochrome P450 [Streptomyces sp. BR123]|uniref:cytochrome P450 n=1 Tax=Streptomyces sp. BR123 TaxID=2749828 RepID=UPI001C4F39D0|nr:cytochrome P450 [Streptomyces sp. BR123]
MTETTTTVLDDRAAFLDVADPGFMFTAPEVAAAREAHWYAGTPYGVMVLRHAQVQQLLRDRRLAQSGRRFLKLNGVTHGTVHDWFDTLLLHLRGEEHRRQRALVLQAFAPQALQRWRSTMRRTAERLADRLAGAGPCEFGETFADPMAVSVMSAILGVPLDDYEPRWSTDIGLVYSVGHRADALARVERSLAGLRAYADHLVSRHGTARTGDDLVSLLMSGYDGEGMDRTELRDLIVGLFFAAHDTTRNQLGQMLFTFTEHPDQWELLAERPELAEQATDEVVRWCPAAPAIFRFALEDVDFEGLRVPAESFVMLCVHAAQRDPRVFDSPDVFDITLRRPPLLSFGAGPHYCLGAATVKAEITEILTVLPRRLRAPRLTAPVVWRNPIGVCGPESLTVNFQPRTSRG